MADAGEQFAHVADLLFLDSADTIEEVLAEFGQRVAIGGGEADSGNDDAGGVKRHEQEKPLANPTINAIQA